MRGKCSNKLLVESASRIDLARLAAFIDGEGCILLKPATTRANGKVYKTLYLAIHIINTDPRLPLWCIRNFGGRVYLRKKQLPRKTMYDWAVFCKEAEVVLRACLPYFIFKGEQAELALAYQSTLGVGGRKVPPEVRQQRVSIEKQMRAMRAAIVEPSSDLPIKREFIN